MIATAHQMIHHNPQRILRACAVVAWVFGLLTIAAGGAGLFGPTEYQTGLGAYVNFVLWFNFLAGFAYVVTGLGLWQGRSWSVFWSWGIVDATTMMFVVFGIHVLTGGAFEVRTVLAMTFRLLFWLGIAWVARRYLSQPVPPRRLSN